MGRRYPNLYDRDRWRRYGFALVVIGIVTLGIGLFLDARDSPQPASGWVLAGTIAIGLATSFWLRQRYSYLRLEGDRLLFRVMLVSQRIDLSDVRRARVLRLGAALERGPGRRSVQPPRRWRETDALILRLRQPDDGRLRRLLSRRCVFEDEVVVPVGDAAELQREIEAALAPVRPAEPRARAGSRRRGRRR
jgi:hypothetical protein